MLFVVSTEKAQFTPNQLRGAGAGCGQSQGGWKLNLFSSFVCKREFVSFRLVSSTCFNISPLKCIILIGLSLIRNDASLLPCLNFQYNFKKQDETAVRQEVVELGNLLDGVRI